ncbi:MAG: hypothetical protein GF346_02870 [Candidatus Eisenbacteria bacterium]|nr:hypothetical protein [Candidatus Latescibacterota bacterium]MBD3301363.1 hypothetical protein [Candidatus Eisenbacteria bacterium]
MVPLVLALAVIGLLAAGCSEETTGPGPGDSQTEVPDLDDPLGGYTTQDELPAFGDPDLAESAGEESPYDDAMGDDPKIARWRHADADSVHAYVVTILWGMMARDPSMADSLLDPDVPVTDWSGALRVDRGGVLLRSTVAFERGDHIVRPRTDRTEIAWVSHTTVSYDGLRIVVYQPFEGEEDGEDDTLVIEAGTHVWEFAVNDLAELDFEETVDDAGNKFVLRSFLARPEVCGRGFIGGTWLVPENPEEERGVFRGRWVSADGRVAGYVRGFHGVNGQGREVFYGKYIDLDGTFRGILRGTWNRERILGSSDPDHPERHHGTFNGEWIDQNERVAGSVKGAWVAAPGAGRGFFEGRWKAICSRP